MHAIGLALMLILGPRAHPGSEGMIDGGPTVPSAPEALDPWLRNASGLRVRSDTRWAGRRIELAHGGWLWLVRERYAGHPVAGARLALRVGPDGKLRQVIGTSLTPALELDPTPPWSSRAQLWWPDETRLIPVRVEDTPLEFIEGVPQQARRYIDARSGEVLASESMIDEVIVPIRGWPENPLTTPQLVTYDVPLADLDPIVLQDAVFRVLDCNYSEAESGCDSIFSPTTQDPNGFPAMPPPVEDVLAHRASDDPYAALQFMQYAARAELKLAQWGWDPFAWDVLDCNWQQTEDPNDCRVWVRTNVLSDGDEGPSPYAGAFYTPSGVIHMGQGYNADTAYDGDVVMHEIGHHVTWSFGTPEATESMPNPSRLITDYRALNEASSDFFAWMLGQNDRIYDYFCTIEPGPYDGVRIRDVSLPFRCPQNVVGEIHMDGRIWVSAVVDGLEALEDAGLADPDSFAITYYGALAAIRHIPREQKVQLPEARAILLDEIELSFGPLAQTLVRDIFDARGIGRCDYTIDLRAEPSLTAFDEDEDDILDARLLEFRSHLPSVAPDKIAAHPFAPPVQHRITLSEDETGVALRYRSSLWRFPQAEVEFLAAALVKAGDQSVVFAHDELGWVVHDAELRFESTPDGEHEQIVIDGLEPGQTYTIALVSLSPLAGDDFVMEAMNWTLLGADPPGAETGGESEGDSEDESEGDSGDASGPDDAPLLPTGDASCNCTSTGDPNPGGWWMLALLALGLAPSPRHHLCGPKGS